MAYPSLFLISTAHRCALTFGFVALAIFEAPVALAATCTFNGNGDGSSWSDGGNWSCGSEPDPSNDDVIIPNGFNVINDGGTDLSFENGRDLTIQGSLDMEDKKIEMKDTDSFLSISSTGTLTDVKELFFNSDSEGTLEAGATINIKHLKIDDGSTLTIETRCIDVTEKLENLSSAGIVGTGCINYTGSSGDFTNSGSQGIFGCTDPSLVNCSLDGGAALPIELFYFKAMHEGEKVTLRWCTLSEINNEYFIVERSKELINWEMIATVGGAGNSTEKRSYDAVDPDPFYGQSYYRLLQKDFNGQRSHSNIETVNWDKTEELPAIYPNPANRQIAVSSGDVDSFVILSSFGDELLSGMMTTNSIDVSHLPSGSYWVLLHDGKFLVTSIRLLISR